jgi:hypothetical protein
LGIVELALMLQHLMTMFKLQVWDCSSFCWWHELLHEGYQSIGMQWIDQLY